MNADAILAPVAAISALAYAGLSALTVISGIAPAIEGKATAPAIVYPGEMAPVRWTIVKRTDCPGTAARVWIGQEGFTLTEPAQQTVFPPSSEPVAVTVPTRIPSYAPDGPLSMQIEGQYTCPGQPPIAYMMGPVEMTVERDGK